MTVMRSLVIAVAVLTGFAAGVAAQRNATGVSLQGMVIDNNTIPEEIEYWELRSATGESIVVTGRRDLPMIRWFRQAKGRMALLSVEPAAAAASR